MARRKRETAKDRQARRERKRERERAEFAEKAKERAASAKQAFSNFDDVADDFRNRVKAKLDLKPDLDLTYCRDAKRGPQPLDLDDLALALFAVDRVGDLARSGVYRTSGVSYAMLGRCFREHGRSCHNAKAARLLALLRDDLALIVKTGGHSSGRHGTQYEVVRDGERPPIPWTPRPRRDESNDAAARAAAADEPLDFGATPDPDEADDDGPPLDLDDVFRRPDEAEPSK